MGIEISGLTFIVQIILLVLHYGNIVVLPLWVVFLPLLVILISVIIFLLILLIILIFKEEI